MSQITPSRGLLIGELSRRTGVNIETIRYYERSGIMPKPKRSEGGHRLYNSEQLNRLAFIKRSRELGFSLKEVCGFLTLIDSDEMTCGEIHVRTMDHLTEVRQKIADLKKMERTLKVMAEQCSRGDTPDCPIVDDLYHLGS